MITIENRFNLEQIVYVKTDEKQSPRIVTAFNLSILGLRYQLSKDNGADYFYECEVSEEKNFLDNRQKVGFSK